MGGKSGRSIFVGRHQDRIAAARAAQAEPGDQGAAAPAVQGRAQDRPPPGPGHAPGPLPGPTKDASLQALLAATVANFKRLGVLGAFDARPPSPLPPDPGHVRRSRRRSRAPTATIRPTNLNRPVRAPLGAIKALSGSGWAGSENATSCRLT